MGIQDSKIEVLYRTTLPRFVWIVPEFQAIDLTQISTSDLGT